jgi:5-methylcytosine-specific restriction endonuclease McrA
MSKRKRRSLLRRRLYRLWYRRVYLRSRHWRRYRLLRLAWAHNTCERCGRTSLGGHLDVHHVTYARLGHEHMGDTRVLCRRCHIVVEGRGKRVPVIGR